VFGLDPSDERWDRACERLSRDIERDFSSAAGLAAPPPSCNEVGVEWRLEPFKYCERSWESIGPDLLHKKPLAWAHFNAAQQAAYLPAFMRGALSQVNNADLLDAVIVCAVSDWMGEGGGLLLELTAEQVGLLLRLLRFDTRLTLWHELRDFNRKVLRPHRRTLRRKEAQTGGAGRRRARSRGKA